MKKSSKARAQDPQDVMENTATELAENAVISDPHVAIGIRGKKVVFLRAHEVTEEDMLFRREILERDRDLIESGNWLKGKLRKPRLTSLITGITGIAVLALGVTLNVVMYPTLAETDFLNAALLLHVTAAIGITLSFFSFFDLIETRSVGGQKANALKLAHTLKAPRGFRRNDGSRYVMNTPNYDELYEAFELLNQVEYSHNRLESISSELLDLVSARKDEKTLAHIAELESDQEKHENLVKDYEDRIAVLLASDGAGNESIKVTLIERGRA